MKKKWFKGVVLGMATVLCMGMMAGCGSSSSSSDSSSSSTVSMAGSTSMEKVCEALSESFMKENSDIKVTCEYFSSCNLIAFLRKVNEY